MINETCSDCKFKLANPQDLTQVSCRRFPPQVVALPVQGPMQQVGIGPVPVYPSVHNKQPACGEYQKKVVLQ